MDKVRWIVPPKLRPFHFQTKTRIIQRITSLSWTVSGANAANTSSDGSKALQIYIL